MYEIYYLIFLDTIFFILIKRLYLYNKIDKIDNNIQLHFSKHLSTLHAVIVNIVHLFLLLSAYDPYFDQYRLNGYNWIFSWSLAYVLIDFYHLWECRNEYRKSFYVSIVFHHFLMLFALLYSFYSIHILNDQYEWYISIGFLTELSTPLLNYIQINHGKVNLMTKKFFAFLYFWCRPVNLTYLSIISYYRFGTYAPFSLICYLLAILNFYWFYMIHYKIIESERESTDKNYAILTVTNSTKNK